MHADTVHTSGTNTTPSGRETATIGIGALVIVESGTPFTVRVKAVPLPMIEAMSRAAPEGAAYEMSR